MNLRNKKILLISPEPWDHIFVSKHHYAIHLSKLGNTVFFLNPPSTTNSLKETEFQNVFSVTYLGFPQGLRFYPKFLQRFFIKRKFNELHDLCKTEFDIVWSFDNSVFFDFSALPNAVLKLSHIVDLNQNFQVERAATTADYCFCTTDLIKGSLLKFSTKVTKINHGFNQPKDGIESLPLIGTSPIKTLYAGNLAMPFIDWIIILKVVIDNPNVDFIFIGPNKDKTAGNLNYDKAKRQLFEEDNAFFMGRINSDELLRYQKAADILLLAYQEDHHADQSNPHKMMEYLGSGKMIVSTFTSEYTDLAKKEYFLMSDKNAELPILFKKTVSELQFWNSSEKMALRRSFAQDNTYSKQIARIEACIAK